MAVLFLVVLFHRDDYRKIYLFSQGICGLKPEVRKVCEAFLLDSRPCAPEGMRGYDGVFNDDSGGGDKKEIS